MNFNIGDKVQVISKSEITWDPHDKPYGWDSEMYTRCGKIFHIVDVRYSDYTYAYILDDASPSNDGWHFKWIEEYLRPVIVELQSDEILNFL